MWNHNKSKLLVPYTPQDCLAQESHSSLPPQEELKKWNVTMQKAESCSMEIGKEEQKEAVAPCSHGQKHDGKFQNVPKKRKGEWGCKAHVCFLHLVQLAELKVR